MNDNPNESVVHFGNHADTFRYWIGAFCVNGDRI